jgi:hypothetical protein
MAQGCLSDSSGKQLWAEFATSVPFPLRPDIDAALLRGLRVNHAIPDPDRYAASFIAEL